METDVVERAARIVEFFVGENEFAESEIADFDIEEGVFAENVFGLRVRSDRRAHLDVAMDDSHAVQIAEAVGERIDDAEGFFFGENRAAADPIEEFAALQKLHYDVNRLSITRFLSFLLPLSIRTYRSAPRCSCGAPASESRSPSGSDPPLSA